MGEALAVVEDVEEAPAEWRIKDVEDADWALKRLAELRRETDQNNAIAAKRIQEISQRTDALNAKAMRGVSFFETHLKVWAEENRKALLGSGKQKYRDLPSGRIGWRKQQERVKVADPKAVLEWARLQPVELELIRFKEEPAMEAIQAHFERTGELPPGCEHVQGTDKFYSDPEKTAAGKAH